MLKIRTLTLVLFSVLIVLTAYAAPVVISRTTRGMMVQGGTSDTTGSSLIVSDSSTNEYKIVQVTATVTGTGTSYTNTFSTPFIAAPLVIKGQISGASGTVQTNSLYTLSTATTTNFIVSGLSTNGVSGVNNQPFILYGYQRTGKFE